MGLKVWDSIDYQRFKFPSRPITDIFTSKDTCIDRSKCRRTVPMKVLVLGLGRTGTVCKNPNTTQCKAIANRFPAMRDALKRLGRKLSGFHHWPDADEKAGYEDTYHMMSASVENPPDCIMWQRAFEAKYDGIGRFGREEWDSLLGHCQVLSSNRYYLLTSTNIE